MVHGPDHVKWYFQCSHQCIGRPMLVKAWSMSNLVVWTNKQERYNNEDNHISWFKVPTGHKCVHVHDRQLTDLSWCYVTLHATLKHKLTFDCDIQENKIWAMGSCSSNGGSKIWVLNLSWVHTNEWWGAFSVSTISWSEAKPTSR